MPKHQNPLSNQSQPRLGVAYFPEHWDPQRWATDARLMAEAGLKTVRMGEFAWCKMEPREGEYHWTWLDEVIDILAAEGLEVILCTPTACPPAWAIEKWPELLPHSKPGEIKQSGTRRYYTPFHEGYRSACRAIAREMATHYGQHPAVTAFQIDNELGGGVEDTGPLAQKAFQDWLAQKYKTPEQLNQDLGLIFWGNEVTRWPQIPVPIERNQNPGLRAAWREFWSDSWIAFCRNQTEIMRPLIGSRRLTTNCFLHRWEMKIDWYKLVQEGGIDVFAFDNYSLDTSENIYYNRLARSLSDPFWILEQSCGNTSHHHRWPEKEEPFEKLTHQAIAEGAESVSFFRWRQGLFGLEQEHAAVLDHHGRPGDVYRRMQELAGEINRTPPSRKTREADFGIVFDWPSAWLTANSPRKIDYSDLIRERIFRAIHESGQQVEFLHRPPSGQAPPFLLLPLLIRHDPEWESFLEDYVHNGGIAIAFPLFFAKDANNQYREEGMGGKMEALFGVQMEKRILIDEEFPLQTEGPSAKGHWGLRQEILSLKGAHSGVIFGNGPHPGSPAYTSHRKGRGHAIYLTAYPDATGLEEFLQAVRNLTG
ncbi:MAG: beta-galactosidase [Opitutales bacterium]|nr:beta-galactosidase [Opitutales bacterium]MCH8541114.1 beta-galactosidase [Opitutales bacterium]